MKKSLFFLLVLSSLWTVSAQKITIKNSFGADSDEVGDFDLFAHSRETDINEDTLTSNDFSIGDRFQIDLDSKYVDGRFRLITLYQNADSSLPNVIIAPSGFAHFMPIKQLGIVAGNNFYKHFAIPSAYLAAADDTTKYGRLLTDSLGRSDYSGYDAFGVYSNGAAGGLTSDWDWGGSYSGYVKLAAGATIYTDFAGTFEKAIDLGVNFGFNDALDFGITAHDILDDDRKFGVFAGLTSVPNMILNVGFYYNFTTSEYLPEARVERSGVDEFKKQSTKYALGLTGGYDFKAYGFSIYGDLIFGLTNEYIGNIKYYDADGNLIDTDVTTIIRGGTCVKYKNGVAKRTDEFTHEGIPLYSQLRLNYKINKMIETQLKLKLRTMINDSSQSWITLYPKVDFTLPSKAGVISTGVKLDWNLTRYEGLSGIAIPLTYTYKLKKKL